MTPYITKQARRLERINLWQRRNPGVKADRFNRLSNCLAHRIAGAVMQEVKVGRGGVTAREFAELPRSMQDDVLGDSGFERYGD